MIRETECAASTDEYCVLAALVDPWRTAAQAATLDGDALFACAPRVCWRDCPRRGGTSRLFARESSCPRLCLGQSQLGGVAFLGGVCLLGVGGWLLFQHDTNWSLGPLILGVLFIAVGVWGLGVLSSRSGTLNDP